MASNYDGFTVQYRNSAGVITNVGAGVSVAIYDTIAAADAAESPLTTDSNGAIAAGSLAAVAVGTLIRFRVDDLNGRSGMTAQITT